ncbi:MAG TPA: hypothetical protein VGJ00_05295 [Rhabdochlamydiaceae bacterium]|jgi:hypothetical protein
MSLSCVGSAFNFVCGLCSARSSVKEQTTLSEQQRALSDVTHAAFQEKSEQLESEKRVTCTKGLSVGFDLCSSGLSLLNYVVESDIVNYAATSTTLGAVISNGATFVTSAYQLWRIKQARRENIPEEGASYVWTGVAQTVDDELYDAQEEMARAKLYSSGVTVLTSAFLLVNGQQVVDIDLLNKIPDLVRRAGIPGVSLIINGIKWCWLNGKETHFVEELTDLEGQTQSKSGNSAFDHLKVRLLVEKYTTKKEALALEKAKDIVGKTAPTPTPTAPPTSTPGDTV